MLLCTGALVGTARIRIEFARKRMNDSRKATPAEDTDKGEAFSESSYLGDEAY